MYLTGALMGVVLVVGGIAWYLGAFTFAFITLLDNQFRGDMDSGHLRLFVPITLSYGFVLAGIAAVRKPSPAPEFERWFWVAYVGLGVFLLELLPIGAFGAMAGWWLVHYLFAALIGLLPLVVQRLRFSHHIVSSGWWAEVAVVGVCFLLASTTWTEADREARALSRCWIGMTTEEFAHTIRGLDFTCHANPGEFGGSLWSCEASELEEQS